MDKLEQVKQRIDKFVTDRAWRQFHTPSNLAKSISIEASELLECFQWNCYLKLPGRPYVPILILL